MRRADMKNVATAYSVYGLLLVSVLPGALSCSAPAMQPARSLASQLEDEIARLDGLVTELQKAELPDSLNGVPKPASASLERPKRASSDLVRLYRLREPFIAAEAYSFIAENAQASANLETIERLWKSSESRFETSIPDDPAHALQRALVQAAGNRAEKLYRASLAYAKIDSPSSGLYYLAEAYGNLRFRDFVASLDLPDAGASINRESLRLALEQLEQETLKTFGADPGANSMIPVSVRLKEARELFNSGLLEGSALTLIESKLALRTRAVPEDAGRSSAAGIEEQSSDGIRSMLLSLLEGEEASLSAVVRNDLIPLYDSLALDRNASPSAPALVTVTLVRWPYT